MIERNRMFLLLLAACVAAPGPALAADAIRPTVRQLIVKYRNDAGPRASRRIQSLSAAAGRQLAFRRELGLRRTYVYELSSSVSHDEARAISNRLRSDPNVEYAEPDFAIHPMKAPNDPEYADQWHYKDAPGGIDLPTAWSYTTGSSSVYIAVLDTGILAHPDLEGRYVGGYDFVTSSTTGNDGDGRDSDATDPGDSATANECGAGTAAADSSWHGTHVAGTIAAASDNGVGVAGINWVSKVVPVRVLGKCGGTTSDLIDAIRWSAGLSVTGVSTNPYPAKVLNLSLGGQGTCGATLQASIDAAVAAGSVVVVSAGNANTDIGSTSYSPANCSGVITVTATGPTGGRAYYSNYGSTAEIAAPGGDMSGSSSDGVLSTLNAGTTTAAAYTYEYYQGTSMAAPHVAGLASLMFSLKPSLTPSEILAVLQSTANAFPTGTGSDCTTSTCGTGIIDAGAALQSINPVQMTARTSSTSGGGCAPSAIAGEPSDPHGGGSTLPGINLSLVVTGLFGIWRLLRLRSSRSSARATLSLLFVSAVLALGSREALAAGGVSGSNLTPFRIGVERRQISDPKLDAFAGPDTSQGGWGSYSKEESFQKSYDLVGSLGFVRDGLLSYGLSGRYIVPATVYKQATRVSTGSADLFGTRLSGYSLGPRAAIDIQATQSIYLRAGANVGGGPMRLAQSVSSGGATTDSLNASAFAIEATLDAGFGIFVSEAFALEVYAGYSRQRTNYFVADSTSGSLYSGSTPGNRIQVQGQDFRIDRSGAFFGAALAAWF